MAENENFDLRAYYKQLTNLFKTGNVFRQRVSAKISAPGQTGYPVGTARAFMKDTNSMYSNMMSSYGQYNRLARYSGYQEMESEALIAAALDLFSEETCAKDEQGRIIKVSSENVKIKNALSELFQDVLNIEFDAMTWIRNLCKYGDQFLMIDHHPDFGVLGLFPLPVNEIEVDHGYDKDDPLATRYRWITQGNRSLEKWQVLHFRMPGNDQFWPYGSSMIEPARRVFRQLTLMEDAIMVYRMVRSPERRVFYIGVGNIAPQDVPTFMEKAKTQLKRNQIADGNGRVDLRMNPMNSLEDYFVPIRGEGDGTRIDTLPGGQFTGDIEDLNYIRDKLFAALKIPKAYLGYDDGLGNKATLSQIDARFARTIHKIQRVLISELNKVAIIHLFSMGFRGEDLLNFNIKMSTPSVIAELQSLELWRTKFEVAGMAQQGTFDRYFVYKNIFKVSDEEIEAIEEGLKKDKLEQLKIDSVQLPASEMPMMDPNQQQQMGQQPVGGAGGALPAAPQAGLPPPPGEPGMPTMGPITSGRDPYKQAGAPNEMLHPLHGNNHKIEKLPDLRKYAFNTKKTAMDVKRNHSELLRGVGAPFGEETDPLNKEQENYDGKVRQMRRFAEEIESISQLLPKSKIISD
jgi:hypothetical protein